MTSWFIDDNVKIIICLHQFLPSRLTHAADLNKNSSKYLLYDIAPGNRVGALTNMFWLLKSVLKVLNWAFTVFQKDIKSRKEAWDAFKIYDLLICYCQPKAKNMSKAFIWEGGGMVHLSWTLACLPSLDPHRLGRIEVKLSFLHGASKDVWGNYEKGGFRAVGSFSRLRLIVRQKYYITEFLFEQS